MSNDWSNFLNRLEHKTGRELAVLYCAMFNKAPDNIINAIAANGKNKTDFQKWVKIYQNKF